MIPIIYYQTGGAVNKKSITPPTLGIDPGKLYSDIRGRLGQFIASKVQLICRANGLVVNRQPIVCSLGYRDEVRVAYPREQAHLSFGTHKGMRFLGDVYEKSKVLA